MPRPITVSQTGAGNGPTVPLEVNAEDVSFQVIVTGTVTYTVQQTVNNPFSGETLNWFTHGDSALVAATTSQQGNYEYIPRAMRIIVSAGDGTATLTVSQGTPS